MKMSAIFSMPTLSTMVWEDLPGDVLRDLFEIYDVDIDYNRINDDRYGKKQPCRLVASEKIARDVSISILAQVFVLLMDETPFAVWYKSENFTKLFVSDANVLWKAKEYAHSYKEEDCQRYIVVDSEQDNKVLKEFAGDLEMRMIGGIPKLTHPSDYTQPNEGGRYFLDYDKRKTVYDEIIGPHKHKPNRDDPTTVKADACAFYYHLLETIPPEDKFVLNQTPGKLASYFPSLVCEYDLCAVVFRQDGNTYMIATPTGGGCNQEWRYENTIYKTDIRNIFEKLKLKAMPLPDKLKAIYFKGEPSCAS